MPTEYYYITVDSETKKGKIEFRMGDKLESQPISEFKLIESREISYHTTEGDTTHIEHGPKIISFTMMGAESKEE